MTTRAYFLPDRDGFAPTALAQGPWGGTISGNYVGGLLGHVIDRDTGDPELQPARLTVDLMRPVAMAPVQVQTSVVRSGRRLKLVEASMTQSGTVVARASALMLRRGEQPPGPRWSTPVRMPPVPPLPDPPPKRAVLMVWSYGNNGDTPAPGLDAWRYDGPKRIWTCDLGPLVAGTEQSPFTRAAVVGEMASSLTHFSVDGLPFINADYTLTLSRLPETPYLGLAALTHFSHAGVATGTAVVVDELGPIGTATATAVANPGFDPAHPIG